MSYLPHRYLKTSEIALALGISERTVKHFLDAGHLPHLSMARSSWRRVYNADLLEFAQKYGFKVSEDALI